MPEGAAEHPDESDWIVVPWLGDVHLGAIRWTLTHMCNRVIVVWRDNCGLMYGQEGQTPLDAPNMP